MEQNLKIEPNNKRIFKNSIYLYARLAIVMILALYTTRLLLDALGVDDYGLYNVVCGFVGLFAFLNTSMANGIQRFYNYEISKYGNEGAIKVYNVAIRIQLLISIVIVLLAETIGLWYVNTEMVIPSGQLATTHWIYQCAILSFLFIVLQVPYSAVVIAYERMNFYAIVSIVDAVLKLAVVFLINYSEANRLIFYALAILCINIFNLWIYAQYVKCKFRHIHLTRNFEKTLFRGMFSFSSWNLLGSFSYVVKTQGINLLLNNFFGTIINAANAVTSQVVYALQSFALNLVVAFVPQLTQSYASGEYMRTERLLNSMSKMAYILFCAMAIPVIFEIDYILAVWLGDNIPAYTADFCILALIATGISCLHTPIFQVIQATGKIKLLHLTTSFFMCSIIPISWINLYLGANPTSVFWVSIVITMLNQIACTVVLYTVFPFNVRRYFTEVIWKCLVYTLLAIIIPLMVCRYIEPSFMRLLIVGGGSLLPLSCIMYILSRDEKNLIASLIRK